MKKIIEFLKKYILQILTILFVVFFFKSCSNSTQIRKLEKINTENKKKVDSLNIIVTSYPESVRLEKIKIHTEYDNWISKKDRGVQLMELHFIVKNNMEQLEK
jgi:hypothetical protein